MQEAAMPFDPIWKRRIEPARSATIAQTSNPSKTIVVVGGFWARWWWDELQH